jgi:hypothetical protein
LPNNKTAPLVIGYGAGRDLLSAPITNARCMTGTTVARIAKKTTENPAAVMEPTPQEESEEEA